MRHSERTIRANGHVNTANRVDSQRNLGVSKPGLCLKRRQNNSMHDVKITILISYDMICLCVAVRVTTP